MMKNAKSNLKSIRSTPSKRSIETIAVDIDEDERPPVKSAKEDDAIDLKVDDLNQKASSKSRVVAQPKVIAAQPKVVIAPSNKVNSLVLQNFVLAEDQRLSIDASLSKSYPMLETLQEQFGGSATDIEIFQQSEDAAYEENKLIREHLTDEAKAVFDDLRQKEIDRKSVLLQSNYNQALETWNLKYRHLVNEAKRRPEAINIPRQTDLTRMTYTVVRQQETQQQQAATPPAIAEDPNSTAALLPQTASRIKTLTNWLSSIRTETESMSLPEAATNNKTSSSSSSSSSRVINNTSNSLISRNIIKAHDIIRSGRALVLSNQTYTANLSSSIVYNTFIPRIEPIPYCWSWVPIKSNCVAEDEKILRALPYFGDDDTTGVDISEFDKVPGELEEEVQGEAEEHLIVYMLERHKRASGIKPEVYSAISAVLQYSDSTENISYSEICKAYERVIEGPWYRIHYQGQNTLAEERRLPLTEVGMFDDDQKSQDRLKPLLDLHGSDGVFFDVDSTRHLHTGVGFGMGILNTARYDTLIGNYLDFFCRRCYTYNCAEHGVEHPVPTVRTDPEPPFLCPIAKLTLPTDKLRLQLRNHQLPPSFTDGTRLPIELIDISSSCLKQQVGNIAIADNANSSYSLRAQQEQPQPISFADSFYCHNGCIISQDPVTGQSNVQLEQAGDAPAWINRPPLAIRKINNDGDAMDVEDNEEPLAFSKVRSGSSNNNRIQPAVTSSSRPVTSSSLSSDFRSSDSNSLYRQDPSIVYHPRLQVFHSSICPDAPEHALIPKPEQRPVAANPNTERIVTFQESFSPPLVDAELTLLHRFTKMHAAAARRYNSNKSSNGGAAVASGTELLPLNQYMQRLLGTRKQEEIDRVLTNPWVFQRFDNTNTHRSPLVKAPTKSAAARPGHINAMNIDNDEEDNFNEDAVDEASHTSNVKSKSVRGRKRGSGAKVKLNTTNKNLFQTYYQPCKHEGDCSKDTDCVCVTNGTFCEKYCACARNCIHKFQGCNCKGGACRTKSCPCFAASRACDPDMCGVCGAGVHPAFLPAVQHFLQLQAQQLQQAANEDGDDGTSSVALSTASEQQLFCLPINSSSASNNGYYDPVRNDNDVGGRKRGRPVGSGTFRSELCTNLPFRVRRKHRLLVGRSEAQGYGAFASTRIEKGEFIAEYRGEIISQTEAERRGLIYDKHDISFLFETNKDQVIDATRKGSKARFINHRTENPNVMPKIMQIDGDHRVGIFANRDLEPSEELYFDYGYKNYDKDWAKSSKRNYNNKEKGTTAKKVAFTGKNRGRKGQQIVKDGEEDDDREEDGGSEED